MSGAAPPRRFMRDSLWFASSQYAVRFILMVRGVLAARLLGPFHYGAWNAISLLMEYGTFANCGTQQGLDRAIPDRIVDGDSRGLERMKRAGLFNIVVLSAIFGAGICLYFARSDGSLRGAWGLAGIALALLGALLTSVAYYHLTLFRSHGNIPAVSLWFLVQSVLGVGVGVALIPALGAWGLLWGWLFGTAVALGYARWRWRGIAPLRPRPSVDSIVLLRVGLPMYLYSAANFVMRSLDRVLILRFIGTEALGFYGLGIMAITFLLYLPDSVTFVLYPHLVRRFREAGEQVAAIRDLAVRAMRAVSLLMPALSAVVYLAADDLVELLFPQFRAGVPALRILCFAVVGLAMSNLASVVLMTLGRRRALAPAAFAMTLLAATLDLAAIHAGHGIRGVAWATFSTFVTGGTLLTALAAAGLGHGWGARLVFTARLLAPLAIAMPIAYVFERFLPLGDGSLGFRALRLAGGGVLFLAAYAACVAPFGRGVGAGELIAEFMRWRARAGRAAGDV